MVTIYLFYFINSAKGGSPKKQKKKEKKKEKKEQRKRRVKTRKAANQTDKGQQNTIKPNPLSSLTLLKRHRLTLFHYYHLCQKIKIFTSIITQKKKNPIKSSTSFTLRGLSKPKKKVSRFIQIVFHRLVAEKLWFQFF